MKSYNHLWEQFISDDNIIKAINRSSRGKRKRGVVKEIYNNKEQYLGKIKRYAEHFRNREHIPIEIYDGISRKKRTIIVPKYLEQIIHHMCVQVMQPIFMKGMYEHSYGSIPERGCHKGKKFIEKWIKHDRKNVKYCLKMDIRHFFDFIPHNIIKNKLAKIIHDKRFLNVLNEIIDVNGKGLPLGFYTSQWLANWYLQDLDHYIKEQLGAVHYIRYMDDMVIFGSNKRKLHQIQKAITDFLENNLGLKMKDNWQVFRFDYIKNGQHYGRFLDFMGFRFYRDRTTLRKSIMLKATRKAKRISKKEKTTIYDVRQIMSYLGYIDCTDTYNMYLKWIKPYVNFQYCKRRISKYDKKQAKIRNGRCKKNVKLQKSTIG